MYVTRIFVNKNMGIYMRYVIAFLLLLTGCTSISTVELSSKSYPAKPENCTIELITQKPDKKFKELILLDIESVNHLPDLMPDIKKRACLAGGDAIIIKSSKNMSTSIIHATVIKFPDPKK